MPDKYIDIQSISDLHKLVKYTPPRHPLVSVIDHVDFYAKRPRENRAFLPFWLLYHFLQKI